MKQPRCATWLAAVALLFAASGSPAQQAQKLYRWTDSNGVVHYGDQVPPKYAGQDRSILNDQGIPVGFRQGELTAAEKAAREKQQATAEAARAKQEKQAEHDRILLQTYLSVDDIKKLRDRRIAVLGAQINVTKRYLDNLQQQLKKLHTDAARYTDPPDGQAARKVPASLHQQIIDMQGTIRSYESLLERTRADQGRVRRSFARDIKRFKELKDEESS